MATIPLAKNYMPSKLNFPVYLSEKLDGVPVKCTIEADGTYSWCSRAGRSVPSVTTIMKRLVDVYEKSEWSGQRIEIIGEVTQRNTRAPFRETSGKVRKHQDDPSLVLNMFECSMGQTFYERYQVLKALYDLDGSFSIDYCYSTVITSAGELQEYFDFYTENHPDLEGLVARSHDDPYLPGKRSWGYQKLVADPTIDLMIVDCDEATSESGERLGMIGRMYAAYEHGVIGVGPGKLTHAERGELFELYPFPQRMACIKYKRDASYTALRQPTFQHWRDDKTEADA